LPPESASPLLERLLVLSLSLEGALAREDWIEIGQLLDAREETTGALEDSPIEALDGEVLNRVLQVDARVRLELRRRRGEVVREFRSDFSSLHARRAYEGQASGAFTDCTT
jgi:hypothetical protein